MTAVICSEAGCDDVVFKSGLCKKHLMDHARKMRICSLADWGMRGGYRDPPLPPGLSEHVNSVVCRKQTLALLAMMVLSEGASEWQLRRWALEAYRCLLSEEDPTPRREETKDRAKGRSGGGKRTIRLVD